MIRIDVPFVVDGQTIIQKPRMKVAAGGRNYFYAVFDIHGVWDGIDYKRAVFRYNNHNYIMELVDNNGRLECRIPHEVMTEPGYFDTGIFGGDRLPTGLARTFVGKGCVCDGEEPQLPTPDWFSCIDERLDKISAVAPENAQVGQVLVVEKVDENGQINKLETIDLPTDKVFYVDMEYYMASMPQSTNRTFEEIKEAYNGGLNVICRLNNYHILPLSTMTEKQITFSAPSGSDIIIAVQASDNSIFSEIVPMARMEDLQKNESNIFYINITPTSESTAISDKTFQEVVSAYNSGKDVKCILDNYYILPLCVIVNSQAIFGGATANLTVFVSLNNDDTVVFNVTELAAKDEVLTREEYEESLNDISTRVNDIIATIDHQQYFNITEDGTVSLKEEYRGAGSATYPASIGSNSPLELPDTLVIPNFINEVEVQFLAPGMFYGNKQVKEIVIPTSVKSIPEALCWFAINLHSVKCTEHITNVGAYAFAATKIKQAFFPNLTKLGKLAFAASAYLEVVDIGKIAEIPVRAFADCAFLREVIGGDNVTTIGNMAFYRTRHLRDLPLLAHVISVEDYAFFYSRVCTSLPSGGNIGTKAFPTSDNNTDFWTGVKYTPCQNRITTKLSQLNPVWRSENVLLDTTDITYYNACPLFVVMHIHSAITGKYYSDPRDFVKELKEDSALSKFLYDTNWLKNIDNVAPMFEALGYRTEVYGYAGNTDLSLSRDDYKALVDALASGAYIYAQVCLKAEWENDYFDGGHAVAIYGINDLGEVCVLDSSIMHEPYRESGFEPNADIYTYTIPYQNIVGPNSNFIVVYPPNVDPDTGESSCKFTVTMTDNGDGTCTPDKNFDEVVIAYESGKVVQCIWSPYVFPICSINATQIIYGGSALGITAAIIQNSDGSCYASQGYVVTPPNSASVGQTIIVKAVDGNGIPIEWEAVDFPSGGGGGIEKAITLFDTTITEAVKRIYYELSEVGRTCTNFLVLLYPIRHGNYAGTSHQITWRIYWNDGGNDSVKETPNFNQTASTTAMAHEWYFNSEFSLYRRNRNDESIEKRGTLGAKVSGLAVDADFTELFAAGTRVVIKAWRDNL